MVYSGSSVENLLEKKIIYREFVELRKKLMRIKLKRVTNCREFFFYLKMSP